MTMRTISTEIAPDLPRNAKPPLAMPAGDFFDWRSGCGVPSVLPDISPSRGEITEQPPRRLEHLFADEGYLKDRAASRLPISP
jgi:hypothetical protein